MRARLAPLPRPGLPAPAQRGPARPSGRRPGTTRGPPARPPPSTRLQLLLQALLPLDHLAQLLLQLQQRAPVGQDGGVPLRAQQGRRGEHRGHTGAAWAGRRAQGQGWAGWQGVAGAVVAPLARLARLPQAVVAGWRRRRQHPVAPRRAAFSVLLPLLAWASASACLTKERERRSSSAFHSLITSSTGLPVTSLGACGWQAGGGRAMVGKRRGAGAARSLGLGERRQQPDVEAASQGGLQRVESAAPPAATQQAWCLLLLPSPLQVRWQPLLPRGRWLRRRPLQRTRHQSRRLAWTLRLPGLPLLRTPQQECSQS